jgi:hypothetical protein
VENFTPRVVDDVVTPLDHAPTFDAVLSKEGVNFIIRAPVTVTNGFARSGHIPVVGLVNGVGIQSTLVPKPAGRHSLFLNAAMRVAAQVDEGDTVSVTLWLDSSDRSPNIDDALAGAFEEAGVLDVFQSFPDTRQREILRWVEDAKQPETKQRRIRRAIRRLEDR